MSAGSRCTAALGSPGARSARRWARGAFAGLAVLWCAGSATRAGAAAYDVARRLELLPGERWLEGWAAGVRVAVAQPVVGLPARAALLALTDRRRGAASAGLEAMSLSAGACRELACAARLRVQGPGMAAGARLEAAQLSIESIERRLLARGAGFLIVQARQVDLGVQWEGPLRPDPAGAAAQVEACARVAFSACAVALSRRSSRYGGDASWCLGMRVRVGEGLSLGFQGGAGESALVAAIRTRRSGVTVGLPLASRMGSGIAVGLAWGAEPCP